MHTKKASTISRTDEQRFDNFDITHWADHVRVVATDPKEAMTRHLAEGCDSCAHLVALVNRIWPTSGDDQIVPEALVDSAKAVFQVGSKNRLSEMQNLARARIEGLGRGQRRKPGMRRATCK